MIVDLNADLGEGAGTDAELMPLITSANIGCGVHAGDEATSRQALELARRHGVRVGAHPGYPDREHFGRRELQLPAQAIYQLCRDQVETLRLWAMQSGCLVTYIKPHGALYNQAMNDREVMQGLHKYGLECLLPIMGMPGTLCAEVNALLPGFIAEGFADRRYRPDGTLVPRSEPDAILHDVKEVVAQVEWLLRECDVQSICVHGDSPGAVEFVRAIRGHLRDSGHQIRALPG